MKIITNDSVYIQKNDIAYLNMSNLPIPSSIFMKVFGNGVTIINDSNRYDFIKFNQQSEIEYFKGLDWMINYNEVKDLSEHEIVKLAKSIVKDQEQIANTFNSMTEEERKNHTDMITKCDLLEFKFYSLRDILWFKQGHISMKLPEGVDYPQGYTKQNGIKRLLKKKNK